MSSVQFIWKRSGAGMRLIFANSLVFLFLEILRSVLHLMNSGDTLGSLKLSLSLPAFIPDILSEPWTVLTHMFIHADFWHILFNMITLYFSYQLYSGYFSDRKFINVYFLSGFSGALIFIGSVNLFPLFGSQIKEIHAMGASAAIIGVMTGICFYHPNDHVMFFGFWKMKLIYLALIFLILDLTQIGKGENEAGHLAHLGGALYGYLWAVNMKKNKDISAFFGRVQDLFQFSFVKKKQDPKKSRIPFSDEEWNQSRTKRSKKIDEILDKISRSGYDSLTKEEKRILFEISKEK